MKACYFGIYKQDFTRTRVITEALKSQGIEVVHCVDTTPSLKKYWNLVQKHRALKGQYDFMIVGFPGYYVMFLARLLTMKPIIFDSYISYYDGLLDRRNYSPFHPKMILARFVDWAAAMCSIATLTINPAYKEFFVKTLHIPASKMEVLHKGADESIFYPRTDVVSKPHEHHILWWGNYIPLHGAEYIVEAANLLKDRNDIEIHMVGRGQQKEMIEKKARGYHLDNLVFLGRVSDDDLIREITEADACLGIFNNTPKALRCVTNKVYEAMAMGKAIITEKSGANAEVFTDRKDAYLVPPADPAALATAITEVADNQELRTEIARNTRALFERRFTTEKIGEEFRGILVKHGLLKGI